MPTAGLEVLAGDVILADGCRKMVWSIPPAYLGTLYGNSMMTKGELQRPYAQTQTGDP
jgi:hypothetical protein